MIDHPPAGRKKAQRAPLLRKRAPVGAAPGTLVADPLSVAPTIRLIGYDEDKLFDNEQCSLADVRKQIGKHDVLWIDVDGLADVELVRDLGQLFNLHDLELEDVVNVHQRSKAEVFDDHVFIVARMWTGAEAAQSEQISLFVGKDYVLSFQERPDDCFDAVRARLAAQASRFRQRGPDYLAYALIDSIVDAYFPILEQMGEDLGRLEDRIIAEPEREHVNRLHEVKGELLQLRRAIWPAREMLNALVRGDTDHVNPETRIYLRDTYDHTIQLIDIVETYREIASGLLDVYLSSMSARLNEVMKLLTIISTVFIPLSFLASLWGMNFDTSSPWNMPELGWRFGYPAALSLMFAIACALFWFFHRKKWLD